MPLKAIFKAIRAGDIRVNEKKVKQNCRLKIGDKLYIYTPLLNHKKDDKCYITSSKLDMKRIVYEDENLLIYNKPRGVIVHGEKDSLDVMVKDYLSDKVKNSLSFSPGPLHRLDRNTEGLIVFSVSLNGARTFTQMLQQGDIQKYYITIVDGEFKDREEWIDNISRDNEKLISKLDQNGKKAHSIFIPLYRKNGKTVALIEIKTGRTHQIRTQCSIHSRPLSGDIKYNNNTKFSSYFLAALSLTFSKNSDILLKRSFSISLCKMNNPLIRDILNKDEVKLIDDLAKKEMGIK